jgi:drug/metabolite transporter (DMT)-like permease
VDLDVEYATTLVAAALLGIGFVLQQYSAEQEPESRFLSPRILTDLLHKPRWLLGIACMVAGYLLAAWSIGHLELTLVEPLLTTYLVWALVLAVPMSGQAVGLTEVAGALILIGGVTVLSVTRSTTPVGLSFGSFSHWYAAAIIASIAFAAVQAGHRRRGHVRATLTGLGAGLVFGIQDALTRQTLEILQGNSYSFWMLFTNWPVYALVGAGIIGIWLMQNAFSAAPLRASLPAIAAGEPVAGIALGIVVFGDRVQISTGMLAMEAGGIAALIIGVVAVARSSAFSGLRRITHTTRPGRDSASHRTRRVHRPEVPNGSAGRKAAKPRPASGPRTGHPTRRLPRSRHASTEDDLRTEDLGAAAGPVQKRIDAQPGQRRGKISTWLKPDRSAPTWEPHQG